MYTFEQVDRIRADRYRGLRQLTLMTAILIAGSCGMQTSTLPAFERGADQNILLITIDTLRADALGAYGGAAATPHIDHLVDTGARFTFAHAHAVVTLPSHTSILTGRYPFDHGVRDNAGFRAPDSLDTVAELLSRRGRPTGAFVGAFPLDRQFGLAQGFDRYDDAGGVGVAETDFRFTERPATEVVAAASNWIGGQTQPWFAWVHVFDPHAPYAPPPPFDATYASNPYAGEVAAVDAALGTLLDTLSAADRRTTIILTADHGEGLGDHGEATHGTFAYESTLRVPLIVSQVGGSTVVDGGRVITTPVQHVDIVPTIADLVGLDVEPDWPGRSLLSIDPSEAGTRATYFEAMTPLLTRGWAPLKGLILDGRKYIDLPIEELYDLNTDSHEQRNIVAGSTTDAQTTDVLRARLRGFGATLPGQAQPESADARARLEALGYVARTAARPSTFTEADDPKRLIDLDRRMLEGIAAFEQGRVGDAEALYQSVIAERPSMSVASLRLAFMQWESGAVEPAIATLRAAAERHPDTDVDVRLATYLADSGNVTEAIRLFQRVLATEPTHRDALNGLGIAYVRSGNYPDALKTFDQVLRTYPRDVQALENIGTVHLTNRDWTAAATAFEQALSIAPDASRAAAGLGVVALQRGDRNEAIRRWQQAVDNDPKNFDALFNLSTELVNVGRLSEARPLLRRFVQTAPPARYGPDIARVKQFLEGGR